MGFADIRHGFGPTVERRGAEHQQAGVDEKRQAKRERGIPGGEAHGLAALGFRLPEITRADDRRVQVEVMRHHRGADDTQRDEEHTGARQHVRGGNEASHHLGDDRLGEQELDADAGRNRQHEHSHERLQPTVT